MMKLTIDGYPNLSQNKYFKLYKNIIINRINNPLIEGYTENHHILPKSMGGDESLDNMVKLSARDHYLVHYLIQKFTIKDDRYKMIYAFNAMNMKSKFTSKRYMNSKLYESCKKELSKIQSYRMKELFKNNEYRERNKQNVIDSWKNGKRDEQKEYMKNNSPFKNKEIHAKTMTTREKNGTNIWITNNPMKDPIRAKEIASSRSGENHYLRKLRKYYYRSIGEIEWIIIDHHNGLENALKELGFSYCTYMKMLSEDYTPSRGNLKNIEVKRVINED